MPCECERCGGDCTYFDRVVFFRLASVSTSDAQGAFTPLVLPSRRCIWSHSSVPFRWTQWVWWFLPQCRSLVLLGSILAAPFCPSALLHVVLSWTQAGARFALAGRQTRPTTIRRTSSTTTTRHHHSTTTQHIHTHLRPSPPHRPTRHLSPRTVARLGTPALARQAAPGAA